jgi:hypothetical protein
MADDTTTHDHARPRPRGDRRGEEDQRVPYERFQQANKKAKEAAEKAKALEKDLADLQAQLEEREQAGLPELEQLKKRLEQAEKRAEEAERAPRTPTPSCSAPARSGGSPPPRSPELRDPSDASAFVDLDDIEDEKDASGPSSVSPARRSTC